MKNNTPSVKVGCCGFRSAMIDYVRHFPVVEVQQTFYQPPQIPTLERWRAEAPRDFEFTLKAWQLVTHEARSPTYRRLKRRLSEAEQAQCGSFRPTAIVREAWDVTLASARALGARRILFQCPASFTPTREHVADMRGFFASIERDEGMRFLWEPRSVWGTIWCALCTVISISCTSSILSRRATQTPDECYFRLHGRGGWRYVYEDGELEELVTTLPGEGPSYVLFNNLRRQ